jgi:ribonuclease III
LSWFSFLSKKSPRSENDLKLIKFILIRFGYRLNNVDVFYEALTHKSYSNTSNSISNERLEFLGDAILDAIIADFLYQKFPFEDEGHLTKVKSKLVSRKTLAEIAQAMGVGEFLRYSKGRSINMDTLQGNALEALIGAVYLDGGFEATRIAIENYLFRNYIDLSKTLVEEIDFKSNLFIWVQKNKLEIEFQVISEVNEGPNWVYTSQVVINNLEYGRGTGTSKKAAEQEAAKETLILVGEL